MFVYDYTYRRVANLEAILALESCDKYSGVKQSVIEDLATVGCPLAIALDSGYSLSLDLVREFKANDSGLIKARYTGRICVLVSTMIDRQYPVSFDSTIIIDYRKQAATFDYGLPMFDGKDYPNSHLHDGQPTLQDLLYVVGSDSQHLSNHINHTENLQRLRKSWIRKFDHERCR